jgi:hypothetical protein
VKTLICFFGMMFSCLLAQAREPDTPNADLPRHVLPQSGKLTLFADYMTKTADGSISVYLINGTKQDVTLSAQDGDVYLKLECKDDMGHWTRAQPHAFSWCGNSYFYSPKIRPSHFLLIKGYQPKAGDLRAIRYSLYNQEIELSSNVGGGLVTVRDVDLASRDVMAISSGDFEFVSDIALGKNKLKNELDHNDLQDVAIRALAYKRFDRKKSQKVLFQVRTAFPDKRDTVNMAMIMMIQEDSKDPASKK